MNLHLVNLNLRNLALAALAVVVIGATSSCTTTRPTSPRELLSDREIIPAPFLEPATEYEAAAAPTPLDERQEVAVPPPLDVDDPVRPVRAEATSPQLPPAVIQSFDGPQLVPEDGDIANTPPTPVEMTSPMMPTLPEPPESNLLTYTVKKGDSLWEISRMYGVSWQELAAQNNMDGKDVLRIGKVLTIPAGGKFVPADQRPKIKPQTAVSTSRGPSKRAIPADGLYQVQKGDSLWVISRRFGVSISDLRAFNGISGDKIKAGETLALTSSAAGSRPRGVSTSRGQVTYTAAVRRSTPTEAVPASGKYTVKSGDNPWTIARRFGLTTGELLALNDLQKGDLIHPGDTLLVKGDTTPGPLPANHDLADVDALGLEAEQDTAPVEAVADAVPEAPRAQTMSADQVKALQRLPHYVEPTDTLDSIATMYNSKVEWILLVNPAVKSNVDLATTKQIEVPVKPIE